MSAILKYTTTTADDGKTVETICKKEFNISSGLLTFLKLNGKLRINGEICRSVDILSPSDVLTIDVSENEASSHIVSTKMDIDIVYEDDYILIVNKPRNLCVHPSMKNFDNTLANGVMYYLRAKGENYNFHAVNRIDKNTSGLCIIAKNRFAHGILSEQIKAGVFERKYMAIIKGCPHAKSGTIDKPIRREKESIIKRIVAPDGQRAITHYTVLKTNEKYSLVDIVLETGRTHQIRVHFADVGYPLVGDWLYGSEDKEHFSGHLLHAYFAKFLHPVTKETIKISLPLPFDMEKT